MTELASGRAYEGRKDLGNVQKGDGVRYKGRGPLQVTGRANYKALAKHLLDRGEPEWDVVTKPELVATTHAFSAAGNWWETNCANAVADEGDTVKAVQRVSRLVNRGSANASRPANHESERVDLFRKVAAVMRAEGVWT
jgi:putative chitinase